MSEFKCPHCGLMMAVTPKASAEQNKTAQNVDYVKSLFPEALLADLEITQSKGYVHIKARRYLGKETFNDVLTRVKGAGGKYVSDKKNSHFEI